MKYIVYGNVLCIFMSVVVSCNSERIQDNGIVTLILNCKHFFAH